MQQPNLYPHNGAQGARGAIHAPLAPSAIDPPALPASFRLAYIAYPTSLMLRSANAIQTHSTLRALHQLAPATLALIPRWLHEPSRFHEVHARHLPRPAIGKLSRFHRSTLWYYAERSVFAAMTAAVLWWEQLLGHPAHVVYVRETLCAAWWAGLWGPLLKLPVVYEAHDLESWNPSRAREGWVQPLLNLLDRVALTRSAAVVSLTDDFRRLLARLGWRPATEVAVIPDAFDEQHIIPGDRAAARELLGLDPRAPLIVYAGMTFSYRGLERLLAAFARLRITHPTAQLIFVGGRPAEIAQLQQEAALLEITDIVTWTGQRPQDAVVHYLQAADLLVIPDTVTDVTASPLKLFEYLAAARAVALPDIPALTEILPASVGYYFRRGDTESMASALQSALSDPQRAEREKAGRALVQPYTYTARAAHILSVAASTAQKYGTM